MKTISAACLLTLVLTSPLAAQTRRPRPPSPPPPPLPSYPAFAPRAFVEISEQQFAAKETFKSVFGESAGPFRGGGVDLVLNRSLFVEISASQYKKTGQRLFRSEGKDYRLGIPLSVKVTPIELIGGYRLRLRRWPRVIPYAGIGFGSFKYEETSQFNTDEENVDLKKKGLILVGGAEFRVFRWVGVSLDAHYSHVSDIIGIGGISQEFKEDDLGGTAARFRVIIGR